jgi:hypothetical protein
MHAAQEIAALKTLYPEISAAEEGQVTFLRIENLILPDGANPQTVTGLLCPVLRDGYQSRLFLSSTSLDKGCETGRQNEIFPVGRSTQTCNSRCLEQQRRPRHFST